jgi:toxin FitB
LILLDTNVLSELMRPRPQDRVVRWLDARPDTDFWITAVTASEIRVGIALLPDGARKSLLFDRAEQMLEDEFGTRCLPYDCEAAGVYPAIVAERRRMGRPITVEDAQVAAIALTAGLTLATRNTADFEGIRGLSLVDPWLDSGA